MKSKLQFYMPLTLILSFFIALSVPDNPVNAAEDDYVDIIVNYEDKNQMPAEEDLDSAYKDVRTSENEAARAMSVPEDEVEEIKENSSVEQVRLNKVMQPTQATTTPEAEETPEAEQESSNTWNTDMVGAPYAWDEGITGEGVNIAVVDTGFYADHEDITYAGGTSLFPDDPWTNDHVGHGSHVAGTIGADLDSPNPGVAPGANIYGVKVYEEGEMNAAGEPTTDVFNITEGIYEAMQFDPQMIVISSGLREGDPALHEAIKEATSQGIVVIAASGNGNETIDYPSAYPEVVSVTSVDQDLNTAQDSIYSLENDFTAPGVGVTSLSSPNSYYGYPYATLSGSSQAVPHVAGVMALLMERYDMTAQGAQSVLADNAVDLGYRGRFGNGLAHYLSPYRRAQVEN